MFSVAIAGSVSDQLRRLLVPRSDGYDLQPTPSRAAKAGTVDHRMLRKPKLVRIAPIRGAPHTWPRCLQTGWASAVQAVFVITGVCQPGNPLNLDLARFLKGDEHQQILWIDFKDPHDLDAAVAQTDAALPGTRLCAAPNAVWGGASIVSSMLAAVAYCAKNLTDWTNIVFCAMQDVPLVSRTTLLPLLSGIAQAHDYVGSKWNRNASDLVDRLQNPPLNSDFLAERIYERFIIRGDTVIRREVALAEQFPSSSINSLRLCNDLFERYLPAVAENVAQRQLSIHRMTPGRAAERFAFFSRFGLYAGRQWCVLSRRFCELLLSDYVDDIFRDWFSDVLIPDECFFQTIASHYTKQDKIRSYWKSLYFNDAQNYMVWPTQVLEVAAKRAPHELFARKSAASADFAAIHERT